MSGILKSPPLFFSTWTWSSGFRWCYWKHAISRSVIIFSVFFPSILCVRRCFFFVRFLKVTAWLRKRSRVSIQMRWHHANAQKVWNKSREIYANLIRVRSVHVRKVRENKGRGGIFVGIVGCVTKLARITRTFGVWKVNDIDIIYFLGDCLTSLPGAHRWWRRRP